MTKTLWAELTAFDWYANAKNRWPSLTEKQRRAVYSAAKAEEAANVAYGRAVDALGRAGR